MNPTLTHEQALDLLGQHGVTEKVAWIGLRSKDSVYGENDAYTDTLGLLTPDGYTEYKLNTLPTKWTPGMACLVPGTYKFRQGIHGMHHINIALKEDGRTPENPKDYAAYQWLLAHPGQDHPDPAYRLTYWAFREVPPMTVIRNGETGTHTDSAAAPFWIDLHHGGLNTTSSEACQTVPLAIWKQVRTSGFAAMDKYGQKEIVYLVTGLFS